MTITGEATEQVAADQITVHPKCPRRGNIDAIAQSIARNGWYSVLIVQRSTGHILIGNSAYQAGLKLGLTHFPVSYVDLDDKAAEAMMLVDNKTSDRATTDTVALASVLRDIQDLCGDYTGTGYATREAQQIVKSLEPPPEEVPKTKDSVQMTVGDYYYRVPKADYLAWQEELRQKAGYDQKSQTRELRCRLNLPSTSSSSSPSSP